MDDASVALIEELCRVYPEHVRSRLAGLGASGEALDLHEGEVWLRSELEALLSKPYDLQARGPLELFQEAMKFPTAALEDLGLEPPGRDPAAVDAVPGDRYGLAPASSSELGEGAWEAHIRWGATKAQELARPTVGLVSTNLMDRSRLESAVRAVGLRPVLVESAQDFPNLSWALVDLTVSWAVDAMRAFKEGDVPFVAYGPHVDEESFTAAKIEGAREAVPRSRFFKGVEEFLPRLA